MIDLNRIEIFNEEVLEEIRNQYTYHPWDELKINKGVKVRQAIEHVVEIIITNVPACPDRSTALRKLREVRMDCNSAITHDGKY